MATTARVSVTTEIEKAMKKLEAEMKKQNILDSGIEFTGEKFVLPSQFENRPKDAVEALNRFFTSQEEYEDNMIEIQGHPHDTLYWMKKTVEERFSSMLPQGTQGWFFKTNGESITFPIGVDEMETVPIGKVEIPGLPITLEIAVRQRGAIMTSSVYITATYKRSFKPLAKSILEEIRRAVRKNSIFTGKAINDQFQFIDVRSEALASIVYSEREWRVLNANVFYPLEHRSDFKKGNLSLKRTVLLYGAYGSGKSLTTLYASNVALKNGWTVLKVGVGGDLADAFSFAKRYQPCLLIFEDFDSVTDDGRTETVNQILEAMDGALAKDSEVITVITTNHREKTNEAVRRPGRIDVFVELGIVDETSILQLVKAYAGNDFDKDSEWNPVELFHESLGYTPAFVSEGVRRARHYAIAEGRKTISQSDVVSALRELRQQYNWMMEGREETKVTIDTQISGIVTEALVKQEANN